VVVVELQYSGRASPSNRGRRKRGSRGREAPRLRGAAALPLPLLYIGPQGRGGPGDQISKGGGGQGGWSAPQGKWGAPPTLGFSTLGAGGAKGRRTSPPGAGSLPTSAHGALRDRWPHPVDPRDPSGGPGTIPVTPETLPKAETTLPIYNSLPPDQSDPPRDVRALIWDSEQLSICCILIFIQP